MTRNFLRWAQETGTTVGQLMRYYDGRISVYACEVEPGGRTGVSYEDAMDVAREDPSLLYVELTDAEEAEQRRLEAEAAAG